MSEPLHRERLRAQLAGHLERLQREGVWGLPVGEPAPRPPVTSASSPEPVVPEPPGVPAPPATTTPATRESSMTDQRQAGLFNAGLIGLPREESLGAGPIGAPREESLEPVEAEALACVACRLHETRTNVVFGVGNPDARLMFIGEGPGHDEDIQGEPFVGRAGKLLTRIIEVMGFSREEVYIANAVKCRPPKNRDPAADEIASCRHFLMRQVAIIDPEIIVLLGNSAVRAVLGRETPMSRMRGRFLDWNGVRVMCTYHPAYLLRNPPAKKMVWEDMKIVRDALAVPAPE